MSVSRQLPRQVGSLAVLSVVAGLLLAGLGLPVVAAVGWASHSTNDALNNLPSVLDEPPLAQHSVLRAADGTVIATLVGDEDRIIVPLSSIPANTQAAIVAIEDNRFYEHHGVDLRGVVRAAKSDSSNGGYSQGASTITQQYVKQALLEAAINGNGSDAEKKEAQKEATQKSIGRKLREARYAIALEQKLTKGEILERYLNIAYFGEGVYGIGTAAQHYFGVPVQSLTLAQSALLAGLVNSPTAFDPVANPKGARARRDLVLAAVAKYKFATQAAVDAALKTPVVVHPVKKQADSCASSVVPVFCSYVLQTLLADPKVGAQAVYEGGLNIYTSLDLHTQQSVDAGIAANVQYGIRQVTSVVSMEPGTGRILAIGQNRVFGTGPGQSKAIYAAQSNYQVGSTFKAVTLAAAIAAGLPTSTTYNSPGCLKPVAGYPDTGRCPGGVSNAEDKEGGIFDMASATWNSVNTYFIQLEQQAGLESVRLMGQNLGVLSPGITDASKIGNSLTLGAAAGLSVIDMATVYSTLAARGLECDPRVVDRITTLIGKAVTFTQAPPCRQAISSSVADTVTSLLQGVITRGTAAGRGIGRPAAGKTGTLDDSKGAWFIGYVPQLTTAIGIFDPQHPNDQITPMTDLRNGRTYYGSSLFGGDIPALTWQSIMTTAVAPLPVEDFSLGQAYSAPTLSPSPSPSPSPSASTPASKKPTGHPSGKPTATAKAPIPRPTVLPAPPAAH